MARILGLLITIIALATTLGYGQVSGHRGGLLVIKSDLMSPLFDFGAHGGLELVATRRFTFTFDYRYQNEQINGNLANLGLWGRGYADTEKMISHSALFGVRFYGNKALPAPNGQYWYLQGGIARINLKGELQGFAAGSPLANPSFQTFEWTYGLMAAGIFEWGFGYQWIFFKRLSLDASMGMIIASVVDNEIFIYPADYGVLGPDVIQLSDYYNNYGGNIYTLSADGGLFTYGFSAHVTLGILLP